MIKRLSVIDIIVSVLMVLLVAFTLGPAIARMQRSPAETRCQANLHVWANAMALYCAENNGKYPINRSVSGSFVSPMPSTDVPLTQDGLLGSDGRPVRFQYGFNWVENLYPYVEDRANKLGRYKNTFGGCPNAGTNKWPPIGSGANARITYAFNYNLESYSSQLVRTPGRVMMLRELDRLFNSVLRPINDSRGNSAVMPFGPFLDTKDEGISMSAQYLTNPNQHGSGSYIAFADGHVSYFTSDYFPDQQNITVYKCWDPAKAQWFNFGPNAGKPADHCETIAITP